MKASCEEVESEVASGIHRPQNQRQNGYHVEERQVAGRYDDLVWVSDLKLLTDFEQVRT